MREPVSRLLTAKATGLSPKSLRRAEKRLEEFRPRRIGPYEGVGGYPLDVRSYREILAVLQKQLHGLRGRHILEIGPGSLMSLFALKREGAEVAGLEKFMDSDRVRVAARGKIPVETRDLEELPHAFAGRQFDAVISRLIFEPGGKVKLFDDYNRLSDPQWQQAATRLSNFAKALNQKIKPRGLLVMQTLNSTDIVPHLVPTAGFEFVYSGWHPSRHRGQEKEMQLIVLRKVRDV